MIAYNRLKEYVLRPIPFRFTFWPQNPGFFKAFALNLDQLKEKRLDTKAHLSTRLFYSTTAINLAWDPVIAFSQLQTGWIEKLPILWRTLFSSAFDLLLRDPMANESLEASSI